ncbi:MAG: phosphodiester glycosidase family protein [Planctomycetota bacterium]|nr:phosphodiester glycosidase family protein [Planctomycetota bacterium]
MPPPTWIDACREFAATHAVPAWVTDDLAAFATGFPRGGPPAPPESAWALGFEALEAAWPPPLDHTGVATLLGEEADGAQPGTFARRALAVEGILRRLGTPAARILRVGLRVRLDGMLAAPPPRLRRVRALADFYYSLAARLRHPEWVETPRQLEELVAAPRWRTIAPGLEHACIDGLADGMPVHANLLRIDPARVEIQVADLADAASAGHALPEAVGSRARAAISGGFFLYSETDIEPPSARHDAVGLLVIDGEVRNPPTFRRASLLVADKVADVRALGMESVRVRLGEHALELASVCNRAQAEVGPAMPSLAVVGRTVLAVGRSLPVPLNGFVATLAGSWPDTLVAGATLTYAVPLLGEEPVTAGIAGGPMLIEDGRLVLDMRAEDLWGTAPPITFSQDETGDRNLLARMAIGVDAEGRVLAAAIDGRHVERALGMTLADAGRLMLQLGCVRAANLDGGSSKRMLVDGVVVDLATTEIVAGESEVARVRPVHTAVIFAPR